MTSRTGWCSGQLCISHVASNQMLAFLAGLQCICRPKLWKTAHLWNGTRSDLAFVGQLQHRGWIGGHELQHIRQLPAVLMHHCQHESRNGSKICHLQCGMHGAESANVCSTKHVLVGGLGAVPGSVGQHFQKYQAMQKNERLVSGCFLICQGLLLWMPDSIALYVLLISVIVA